MLASTSLYTAYPSLLGNFFTYLKVVELTNESVIAHFKFGKKKHYYLADFVGFPTITEQKFHAVVGLGDSQNTQIRLLNRKQANLLVECLEKKLQNVIIQRVKNTQKLLKSVAFDEYLRDSSINILATQVLPLLKNYQNNQVIWHKYIQPESLIAIKALAHFSQLDELVSHLRSNYEHLLLTLRQSFYDNVESNPLTTEQRLAVIRDNDRNLILAAAGTGKTSVMVAKALDLIDRNIAKPEQILILAYNKDAVKELKSRFTDCAAKLSLTSQLTLRENKTYALPNILTFHSVARQVLTQSKRETTLSSFAENPSLQSTWLAQWLSQQLHNCPAFIEQILNTIYALTDVVSAQPIGNKTTFQTLAGYKVRHYPEYIIANYLYLNNIAHDYKKICTAEKY